MSETLAFGNGGWVFFLKDGVRAFVRFEKHDRRLEPVEVLAWAHDRPLAQTDFRNIPLVKIAGWVEESREALLARMDLPGPNVRQMANDSFVRAEAARRPRRPSTALKVPAKGPYPAVFYRRVAQRYRR